MTKFSAPDAGDFAGAAELLLQADSCSLPQVQACPSIPACPISVASMASGAPIRHWADMA
jgi:hypothetical protein